MTIHALVFMGNCELFPLSPKIAKELALLKQFVNVDIAKEVRALHRWRDRLWSHRYRSIIVADENAEHACLLYP